jgi:MATE family multidrug resistance protein
MFIRPILLALGQSEVLSSDVERFLRVLIFGAPGYIGFESLKKYLQCQGMGQGVHICQFRVHFSRLLGIMGGATAVLAVMFPINIALNIALIHYTSLGLLGSPVALSVTYWICFVLLGFYTYCSPDHTRNSTWGGLVKPNVIFDLKSCLTFLKLALPGILMVGTEWSV